MPSYREYLNVDAPNSLLRPENLNTFEMQVGYVKNVKKVLSQRKKNRFLQIKILFLQEKN